jgi:hypothetical protein
MSQDINSIIKQLAEIDSASAKILQKTQDEKAQYAEMIKQQKLLMKIFRKRTITK